METEFSEKYYILSRKSEYITVLLNEKFCEHYRLPGVVKAVKSGKLQWTANVARMERKSNA